LWATAQILFIPILKNARFILISMVGYLILKEIRMIKDSQVLTVVTISFHILYFEQYMFLNLSVYLEKSNTDIKQNSGVE
jgi:hypothetical protein